MIIDEIVKVLFFYQKWFSFYYDFPGITNKFSFYMTLAGIMTLRN